MGEVFSAVIQSSFYATIIGILIFMIQRNLGDKLRPKYRYLIWVILILKLMFPFGPESKYSVLNLIPDFNDTKEEINISLDEDELNTNLEKSDIKEEYNQINNSLYHNTKIEYEVNTNNTQLYLFIELIWIIGVINVGFVFLVTHYVLKNKIRKNELQRNENINIIFNDCIEKLNIKRNIRVRMSNVINTPSLVGIIRPKIIIPSYTLELSEKEIEYIILHELAHYKRGDMVVNYILLTLQTIHWFNPFIYKLFKLIRDDMELATDEFVLNIIGDNEHKTYGKTIIKVVEKMRNKDNFTPGIMKVSGDKKSLKNRIRGISYMKGYKKGKFFTLVTILSIIMLFVVTFTNKINKDEKSIEDFEKDLVLLEETISKELIKIYTWKDTQGVVVESHITLDVVEEDENVYKAYLLTRGGTFELNKNNKIVESSGEGKSAKTITFLKEGEDFIYKSHEELKDGAMYVDSINEMLPRRLRKYVFEETEYDKELEENLMENAHKSFDNIN